MHRLCKGLIRSAIWARQREGEEEGGEGLVCIRGTDLNPVTIPAVTFGSQDECFDISNRAQIN